jgi:hypothetical protein
LTSVHALIRFIATHKKHRTKGVFTHNDVAIIAFTTNNLLSLLFIFLQYIWDKTGLGAQVPVPWINRKTVPSKSKITLEKKYT